MKVTAFNEANLTQIRKDLNEALKAVQEKHGIAIDIGRMSYNKNSFTAKLSVAVLAAGEEDQEIPHAKWKADFDRNAFFFNLQDQFNKEFKYGSDVLKIVGMQPRKPTVICKHPDGKFIAVPATAVRDILKLKDAA